MTTEWEHIRTLAGDGTIINGDGGETVPVNYELEITREFLVPPHGTKMPRQRNIRGRVHPSPNWRLDTEHVLCLEDGRRLKCWLANDIGSVVCEFDGPL
jgi:hypothetical protein